MGMSASVSLPLHHKVKQFSSGTGSPGWSGRKGRKMVVVVVNGLVKLVSEPVFNMSTILNITTFAETSIPGSLHLCYLLTLLRIFPFSITSELEKS